MTDKKFRSGFAAVVGRPNVGKSTLINKLIGEKISIISDKPQTTRNRIMCVYSEENMQIVFIDTPGMHKPKNKLGEYMVKAADSALDEVNVVLFVVDASEKRGGGEDYIIKKLVSSKTKVVLVINKTDKLKDKKELLPIIEDYSSQMGFAAVVPVSALAQTDFSPLIGEIAKTLLPGPKYFPDDMVTDQPERLIAAELVREKVLNLTRDEVPHSVAVDMEEIKKRPNGDIYMRAVIYAERESQKGIIIGAKGKLLKEIGEKARRDIEALFGSKIYLELWVKVKADWRSKGGALRELGFE